MTLLATHFPQALATLPVSLRLTCILRNEQWKSNNAEGSCRRALQETYATGRISLEIFKAISLIHRRRGWLRPCFANTEAREHEPQWHTPLALEADAQCCKS